MGIQVYDRADRELPKAGLLQISDAETGGLQWIDSGDKRVQMEYGRGFEGMKRVWGAGLSESGRSAAECEDRRRLCTHAARIF